jgi:hypothetical protein
MGMLGAEKPPLSVTRPEPGTANWAHLVAMNGTLHNSLVVKVFTVRYAQSYDFLLEKSNLPYRPDYVYNKRFGQVISISAQIKSRLGSVSGIRRCGG